MGTRILEVLDTDDLTKRQPLNPFWWTGPTNMEAGDPHVKSPWVWMWDVAEGRSKGLHRGKPEHWHTYLDRYCKESLYGWRPSEVRRNSVHRNRRDSDANNNLL